jgi:hypothetical protein
MRHFLNSILFLILSLTVTFSPSCAWQDSPGDTQMFPQYNKFKIKLGKNLHTKYNLI